MYVFRPFVRTGILFSFSFLALLTSVSGPAGRAVFAAEPTQKNGCRYEENLQEPWDGSCAEKPRDLKANLPIGYKVSEDGKSIEQTTLSIGESWTENNEEQKPVKMNWTVCPGQAVGDCVYQSLAGCRKDHDPKSDKAGYIACLTSVYQGPAESAQKLFMKGFKAIPLKVFREYGRSVVLEKGCGKIAGLGETNYSYGWEDIKQVYCFRKVTEDVNYELWGALEADPPRALGSSQSFVREIVTKQCGPLAPAFKPGPKKKLTSYGQCLTGLYQANNQAMNYLGDAASGQAAIIKAASACQHDIAYLSTQDCWGPMLPFVGKQTPNGKTTFPFEQASDYYLQATAKGSAAGGGSKGKAKGKAGGGAGGAGGGTSGETTGDGSDTGGGGGTGGGNGGGNAGGTGDGPDQKPAGQPTPAPTSKPDPAATGKPDPNATGGGVVGGKGDPAPCGRFPPNPKIKGDLGEPVDCKGLSQIPVEDDWARPNSVPAQCPEFVRPYNCLRFDPGQKREGDVAGIVDRPYFWPEREKKCREELDKFGARDRFLAAYHLKKKHECGQTAATCIAEYFGSPYAATGKESSPACQMLIADFKLADPLNPDEIAKHKDKFVTALSEQDPVKLAAAQISPQVQKLANDVADVVLRAGMQRDLGGYSLQQKGVEALTIAVNKFPEILTGADGGAKFEETRAKITGALSCLSLDEKKSLDRQLLKKKTDGAKIAADLKSKQKDLDKEWVADLAYKAERAVRLDKAQFDLGTLYGRLHCDMNYFGGISGPQSDARQCLDHDYETIAKKGDELTGTALEERKGWFRDDVPDLLTEVPYKPDPAKSGYENRLAYETLRKAALDKTKDGFYKAMVTETPGDPKCKAYVRCNDLGLIYKRIKTFKNSLISGNPLLAEQTGSNKSVRACDGTTAEVNQKAQQWDNMWLSDSLEFVGIDAKVCKRKEILADKLLADRGDPAKQLKDAKDASQKVFDDMLKNMAKVCKDGESAIRNEGKESGEIVQQAYLKCDDVGDATPACANRRSYGWAMCWDYMKNVSTQNVEFYKSMAKGGLMAMGGAVAIMASMLTGPAAIMVASGIGITLSASSIYMRHEEIAKTSAAAEKSLNDFRNHRENYEGMVAKMAAAKEAHDYSVAGDVFDVLMIGMDGLSMGHALSLAKQGRYAEAVDAALKEGKGAEAWERAKKLDGPELLDEAKKMDARQAKAKLPVLDEAGRPVNYTELARDGMKASLAKFGPEAVSALDEKGLSHLYNYESRIAKLADEGKLTEAQAAALREEVAGILAKGKPGAADFDALLAKLPKPSGEEALAKGKGNEPLPPKPKELPKPVERSPAEAKADLSPKYKAKGVDVETLPPDRLKRLDALEEDLKGITDTKRAESIRDEAAELLKSCPAK